MPEPISEERLAAYRDLPQIIRRHTWTAAEEAADAIRDLTAEVDSLRAELARHTPGPRLHGIRRPNGTITPGDADWCLPRAATGEGEYVAADTCSYRGEWHEVEWRGGCG